MGTLFGMVYAACPFMGRAGIPGHTAGRAPFPDPDLPPSMPDLMLFRLPLRALLSALLGLVLLLPALVRAEDFLEPDRAFRLEVELLDARTLGVRYTIAPGYYLYRERLALQSEPAGLALLWDVEF